ncbi:hypothetical protein [Methanoregula sp.]|uniref:hypothetical protein n=1 Tax=Methanoregula sp. TaxID=2052170 RepID=UPI003BB0AB8D
MVPRHASEAGMKLVTTEVLRRSSGTGISRYPGGNNAADPLAPKISLSAIPTKMAYIS